MRLSKKQGCAAVGTVALSFLFLAVFAIYEHISEANNQAHENGAQGQYDGPKWTDIAMVLYTFVLTAATLGMWYVMAVQTNLLELAGKTADRALQLATDAERGRMVLLSTRIDLTRHAYVAEFRNVGRHDVVVIDTATHPYQEKQFIGLSREMRPSSRRRWDAPVVAGGTFVAAFHLPAGSLDEGGVLNHTLIFDFSVLYSTMGMRWHYRTAWIALDGLTMKWDRDEYEENVTAKWPTQAMEDNDAWVMANQPF